MNNINWSALPWDAFATLATGLAAVGGAVFVGLRQAAIQAEQVRIAAAQARVAEMDLRRELFDRRFAVYQAALNYLLEIAANSAPPDGELKTMFWRGVREAQFLFRPVVHETLAEVQSTAVKLTTQQRRIRDLRARSADIPKDFEAFEDEAGTWLLAQLNGLDELFGPELRLGA